MEENFLLNIYNILPFGQITMFLLVGVVFEFTLEEIKANIFPKNGMPDWMGSVLGWIATGVYLLMAYSIEPSTKDWVMLGGLVCLPVYALGYYFYQRFLAMPLAKWIYKKITKQEFVRKVKVEKPKSEKQILKEKKKAYEKALAEAKTEEDLMKVFEMSKEV